MSTLVLVSLIVFAAALLIGLGLAGWHGLRAWRTFKAFRRTVLGRMEELNALLAGLEARTAALPEQSARFARAQRELAVSMAQMQVLAEGAGEVAALVNKLRLITPTR